MVLLIDLARYQAIDQKASSTTLLLLQLELRLGIVEAVKAAAYLAIKVIYSGQIAPAEHLVDGRDLG